MTASDQIKDHHMTIGGCCPIWGSLAPDSRNYFIKHLSFAYFISRLFFRKTPYYPRAISRNFRYNSFRYQLKGYRKLTVSDSLQKLFSDLESRGIVCPLPKNWDKLCKVIKSAKKLKMHPIEKGPQIEVMNPLILAAWGASDKSKWERFKYHLSEADQLGILYLAEEFLTKLQPKDFLMSEAEYSDISVWDIEESLKNEVDKVLAEALPFIQEALDLNIAKRHHFDPEKLYALFRERGFFGGYAPTVSDASDLQTVEALRRANEVFNKQADLIEGKRELKDFCYAVLDLKATLRS